MQPLVSIVIPVYNGSNFLRDAIDSALAQTYPRVEVIVVNDGSTDGGATEAIAKSYGSRIRYFAKENGRVASAVNYGIANMNGDYLSWLSHDDMYYPHKIASQIDALNKLDARTVVYGDYETLVVASGARKEHRLPGTKPEYFRWAITVSSGVNGCTLLVPRVCFDECGVFVTTLHTTQDYDMWFRIAGRFRYVHVPGVVVTSRLHPGQDTNHLRGIVLEESDALLAGFISQLNDSDVPASSQNSLHEAYGELAAKMQSRRFTKARDAALVRRCKHDGSSSNSFAIRMLVVRLKLLLLGRRVLRVAGRGARFLSRKVGGNRLGEAVQKRFTVIYRKNVFGGDESRSGTGSSTVQTETIRRELPRLFQDLQVHKMLDAPCGDFNWIQHILQSVGDYVGADVVEELIARNILQYSSATRRFVRLDIIRDRLPASDLIFCRDCLVHLNFDQARKALRNFQTSGAKYLLSTTFPGTQTNTDLGANDIWRPLNLERPPFNLPPPLKLINENCTEDEEMYADKSLGLWLLQELELG